jgi:hypothetical protein
VVALIVLPGCAAATGPAVSQVPDLSRTVEYMGVSLRVPADWVARGAGQMVVVSPKRPGASPDNGTITLEPFRRIVPEGLAMSRYYEGPWRAGRSDSGLLLKIGRKISRLNLGKGVILATEYVRVPSCNVGIGLSAAGGTVGQALAVARAILATLRRSQT